ncbi:hypothetical protein [Bacillus pinisoli]|uniref:hypothetical protein n=1 Tax=Bacillus pinisoli TaxID=2901866 RepID=UPI001FF3418C|nr:hypothetical protein [Bacillus pinisoli]
MLKSKKVFITVSVLFFMVMSVLFNPSKEEYIKFDENRSGVSMPEHARIAEADFIFFSIYASVPKNTVDEYGILHLGFLGLFFQLTDGQFDESIWHQFLK